MSILGVQIIAVLFAVFMLYVAFLHFKRKELSGFEMFFWNFLWIGFVSLALFPHLLASVSNLLFFARVMDLLMITAFMILAFLGFENYIANKKMEKRIEELVRQQALQSVDLKKNKWKN